PFEYGDAYAEDAFFPGVLAELQQPFVLRDARGQGLWLYPVQCHPTRRLLRVYRSLTLRLTRRDAQNLNGQQTPASVVNTPSRAFAEIHKRLFINNAPAGVADRGSAETPEKMLVVTPAAFLPELEPLLAWKRQCGIATEVVTTDEIGSSQASAVWAFVRRYYEEQGISYLLLVGDDEAIEPMTRPFDGKPYACDNCFGYLSGDDHLPEIIVGRLHAATPEQARLMVRRILEYEKTPLLDPQNDWMSAGLAAASDEGLNYGDDGQADWQHGNEWKSKHLADGYTWYWEFYDGSYGAYSPTPGHPTADKDGSPLPNDLVQAIRQRGVSLFNYTGHGWEQGLATGNFNTNVVHSLNNPGRYPILISVGCSPGDFTGNLECLGEAWQRAGNYATGQPWGGIAGFFSSVLQSWAPPMEAQDAMNQYLVDADGITLHPTVGAMAVAGYASMIAAYGPAGEEMTDFWNPFADPTTVPRTRFPKNLSAQSPDTLNFGATELSITCPTEGTLAALYSQGQLLAIARVANGAANLTFDPLTLTGPLTLTLTQFNHLPYQKAIYVRPPTGAFVAPTSLALTDGVAGGNANGRLEYGETGALRAVVRNAGLQSAPPASARVSTTNPYIQWIGNTETTTPALAPGDSTTLVFRFAVRDDVPHGSRADFRLTLSGPGLPESIGSTHALLHAPKLEIARWNLSAVAGYHTRRLQSGEVGRLYVHLRNLGGSPSPTGTVHWKTAHPHLQAWAPAALPSIPESGAGTALLDVEAAADAPPSTWVFPEIAITAGAFSTTAPVGPFVVNPIVETFASANFQQFAWERSGHRLWHISTQTPYEGSYCIRASGHGPRQHSTLNLPLNVSADGWVSFAYRMASVNADDSLHFAIDGVRQWSANGNQETWREVLLPIPAGKHKLTWTFRRGESTQTGHAVFLDEIILPAFDGAVSAPEQNAFNERLLKVWPNPASEWLWIEAPNVSEGRLEVIDALGRLMLQQPYAPAGEHPQPLSIGRLTSGFYVLRLHTPAGEASARFFKR
ncbi:MAG: C25 family cysteine peptidase, partial [Saprospiraceae bacterium]|nr:C25 family cysteine peptidase [Saprospiraceae bacterium]